jgi:hypothetical protein
MLSITPNQFLSDLLHNRGLSAVTAEPLFTYQMQLEEYQQLKQTVVAHVPKTTISITNHKYWAACFVLWCSEWYRREYQAKDGWSWSSIWIELDFELSAPDISDIVPLGIETYWHRPIRYYTERRNFLGSVFIEGGLPFLLISSKDNKFGDLIRKVLSKYYQVDLLGIKVNDLINHHVDSLPKVFAEEESVQLISSILKKLMTLADKIDTTSKDLPSVQLDKLMPNWRKQFPIPLDNDTGTGLLDNWLNKASHASKAIKKLQNKLSCKHYFDLTSGSFYSEITMPQKLNFNFKKKDVNSSCLELSLFEGAVRRVNFGSVYATFDSESTVITTRKKGGRFVRKNSNSQLYVDVTDAGISVEKTAIVDSSISVGDAPLGFILDDNQHLLVGQSSFTTKHPEIFILLPTEFEVDVINGKYLKIESLVIDNQTFNWLQISGDFRFIFGHSRYRICTNATTNTSGMLVLKGRELSWTSKPANVFLGLPTAKTHDDSTDDMYGLTTFIDNEPLNSLQEYEYHGVHILSVKNNNNDTLIKRKIAVLPKDLDIKFACENKNAVITVSTSRPILANLVAENSEVRAEKVLTNRRFIIKPSGLPPSKVTLILNVNLECEPIEITLPYPASGIYGYSADGKFLEKELTINQLLGSEVYLYSNKDFAVKFNLEFSLLPQRSNTPSIKYTISVGDKPQVINLYSFKEKIVELLSLSESLDAQVQINIVNSTYSQKYTVRRFASNIRIDRQNDLVSFDSAPSFDDELIPLAMRMAEPERKPIKLLPKMLGSIDIGCFELASEMKKEGPWLIIPSPNADVDFRPTFYPTDTVFDLSDKEIKSLQTAIKVYHPFNSPNVISTFIEKMATDFTHPSWDYFRCLWDQFAYLPLSTFEAWKALIKSPRGLTMILFKFEMNEEFINRLETELPVLWELIPLENWLYAKNAFESLFSKIDVEKTFVDELIANMLERFSTAVPSFPSGVIEILKGNSSIQNFPLNQAKTMINHIWLQDLLREQSDADWPTDLKYEIQQATNQLEELNDLINIQQSWQSSVVFYPVVAAAISVGRLTFSDVFRSDSQTTFSLKRLRDFDSKWFSSIFNCCVSYLANSK